MQQDSAQPLGKLKIDLHLHTADDPVDNLPLDIEATLENAAALGFDAVAVTLHEKVYVPDARARAASERTGVLLLPGIEATLDHGVHVLILGCGPEAEDIHTLEDLERFRRPEYLIMAPHPFYPGSGLAKGGLLERYAHLIDAVEWSHFYHRFVNFPNRRAAAFAARRRLPLVGTGDAHLPDQMGHTYALVEAERSVASILQAVREGRVETVTRPLSLCHMAWILARLALRSLLPRRRRAALPGRVARRLTAAAS